MHLNFGKLDGTPAANQEVVFRSFRFYPLGAVAPVDDDSGRGLPSAPAGRLDDAAPNPFNPRTTLRFTLDHADVVRLDVFDAAGHRVRTVVDGAFAAGAHEAEWDGRDDAGRSVASGVYLMQLRGSNFTESRPATLLR
jgi:hypothetical protein